MTNTITIDATNQGSFLGPIASRYSYTPALRRILDGLYLAAQNCDNRFYVLEGSTVRAAQTEKANAMMYMTDDRVLVEFDVPKQPEISPDQLADAVRMWSYQPYRKCFVALKDGEDMQVILKPTAHYAGKLARQGWTVRELHR